MSCSGKMHRFATDRAAARIIAHTISPSCSILCRYVCDIRALRVADVVPPPAQRRVVVMRPRICHRIRHIPMRQIKMRPAIRKPKLQNPHPRHPKVLPQLVHLRRNQPQVLRNKRQLAEDTPSAAETAHAPEPSPTGHSSPSPPPPESTSTPQTRGSGPAESCRTASAPAESAPPTSRTPAPSAAPHLYSGFPHRCPVAEK